MNKISNMNTFEIMLRICMIGLPIFTVLAALCAFGWNYYGLKIKDLEKSNKSKESLVQPIQNVYNIGGDYVQGNKTKAIVESKEKIDKKPRTISHTDVILDIGILNSTLNPYFKYEKNNLDFQFTINAVGNSIGYILKSQFTLIKMENNKPIDFKIFNMNKLTGEDLIYKEKPLYFGQQVGNITEPLLNSTFAVIDVIYTNESKTTEKKMRRIYKLNSKYVLNIIPQASADEYEIINKYLSTEKNSLGEIFEI